jgi:hypothetical protein
MTDTARENPIEILVTYDGRHRATELRQPVWMRDGLAVTSGAPGRATRTITHAPSGYKLLDNFEAQEDACALAEAMLELGDWTRSAPEPTKDSDMRQRYFEWLDEPGP